MMVSADKDMSIQSRFEQAVSIVRNSLSSYKPNNEEKLQVLNNLIAVIWALQTIYSWPL